MGDDLVDHVLAIIVDVEGARGTEPDDGYLQSGVAKVSDLHDPSLPAKLPHHTRNPRPLVGRTDQR